MGNCCNRATVSISSENNETYGDINYESLVKDILLSKNDVINWNNKMEKFCSICLENYIKQDGVYITECAHIYHFECLLSWCAVSNKCPLCASPTY